MNLCLFGFLRHLSLPRSLQTFSAVFSLIGLRRLLLLPLSLSSLAGTLLVFCITHALFSCSAYSLRRVMRNCSIHSVARAWCLGVSKSAAAVAASQKKNRKSLPPCWPVKKSLRARHHWPTGNTKDIWSHAYIKTARTNAVFEEARHHHCLQSKW